MAIKIVDPPAAAQEAVLKVLDFLRRSAALQSTALRDARPGTFKLVLPMPMNSCCSIGLNAAPNCAASPSRRRGGFSFEPAAAHSRRRPHKP